MSTHIDSETLDRRSLDLLAPAEERKVAQHLAQCSDCEANWTTLKAAEAVFRTDVLPRTRGRFSESRSTHPSPFGRFLLWGGAFVPIAAMLPVALTILFTRDDVSVMARSDGRVSIEVVMPDEAFALEPEMVIPPTAALRVQATAFAEESELTLALVGEDGSVSIPLTDVSVTPDEPVTIERLAVPESGRWTILGYLTPEPLTAQDVRELLDGHDEGEPEAIIEKPFRVSP